MTTNSPALIVPDTSGSSTNALLTELHDIQPAVEIVSIWEYVLIAASVVAGLVLAYFLVRYFLKKLNEQEVVQATRSVVPAHVRARQQLDAALEHMHDPRKFCILVSDALRQYLEERFELRAPEQTTEEFMEDLKGSRSLQASHQDMLEAFLQQCDLAKFAKADMLGQELKTLYDSGVQFVRETEPEVVSAPGAHAGEQVDASRQETTSSSGGDPT